MEIVLILGDLFHLIPRAFCIPGDAHYSLFMLSGRLGHVSKSRIWLPLIPDTIKHWP